MDVKSLKTKSLEIYVGGLSAPSKMPGHAYSISPTLCKAGSKLREVEGSTCNKCYAFRGNYQHSVVKNAWENRLNALDKPLWAEAMAELITRKMDSYFRWHDAGDLQSVNHLKKIVKVCLLTPNVKHWLPTREYRIVKDFIKAGNEIPANLNIRFSAHMVDGVLPTVPLGVTVSSVSKNSQYKDAHDCPAKLHYWPTINRAT